MGPTPRLADDLLTRAWDNLSIIAELQHNSIEHHHNAALNSHQLSIGHITETMFARPIFRASRLCCRFYATETQKVSPLLLKIRDDLKTAMRNKDTVRLRVVRSLLAQAKRASETKPIETDAQMLKVLTQNINANRDAAEEFTKSGRADLAEKEDQERAIMDEYKDSVPKVGEADLAAVRERIELVLKQLQEQLGGEFKRENVKVGDVLKRVLEGKEGEEILGKFERGEVVKVLMPMLKGTK